MIGTEIAAKMDPDGHVLLAHTSSYPATAAVRAKLPFDPARAIVPVATIAKAPMVIAVHPSVPAKSVKELVALAKKSPGKLNYGSSGSGGNNHFSGALFAAAAGVKMTHVPYKSIAPAVTALASGEIEIVIASQASLGPQIKAGRVYVGVEGDEPSLAWAVKQFGPEAFVFSSDFPHEVNIESCQHEIEELLENDELSEDDKQAILYDNALRFYGLPVPARA